MINIKNVLAFLYIILLSAILTGCGEQGSKTSELAEQGSGNTPNESIFVATWEETGLDLSVGVVQLIGDTIFRADWEWDTDNMTTKNVRIFMSGSDGQESELAILEEHQRFIHFLADESGSVYLLYSETAEDGMNYFQEAEYFIRKYNRQGESVYCTEFPVDEEEGRIVDRLNSGIAGSAGEVCFSGPDGMIYLFDHQGVFQKKVDTGWGEPDRTTEEGFVNAGDDVYLYRIQKTLGANRFEAISSQVDLRAFDMTTGAFGKKISFISETGAVKVFSGYQKGLLLSEGEVLWVYSPDTGGKEELVRWPDKYINIQGDNVEQVGLMEDGSLCILLYEYSAGTSLVFLRERNADVLAGEDDVVIIGYFGRGMEQSMIAQEYNRKYAEYKIEFYAYDSPDSLYMDLLKGRGPDIVDVSNFPIETLSEKGVLEDLRPFFEASDIVKETDLLSCIRNAGSADGELLCVIPGFLVLAYVTEKGYVQNGGWTAAECLALAGKYPDSRLMAEGDLYNIICNLFSTELVSYINWNEKECYYDSDRFVDLLELVKENWRDCPEVDLTADNFFHRKYSIAQVTIGGIGQYLQIKEAFLEDADLAGYPNPEGKPWYAMHVSQAYAINSASMRKEAAWKFMEYMLSEDYQRDLTGLIEDGPLDVIYLPSRVDVFEEKLEAGIELFENRTLYYNHYLGEVTVREEDQIPEFTEDDKKVLSFIVENAYWWETLRIQKILSIIYEEIQPFLVGDKTAEDAARIIQSRVSLYLKE